MQKRSGSEEVGPTPPHWLRTGSAGGVASAQTGLQLFYNLPPSSPPQLPPCENVGYPFRLSVYHGDYRSCEWFGFYNYCHRTIVQANCPMTCGLSTPSPPTSPTSPPAPPLLPPASPLPPFPPPPPMAPCVDGPPNFPSWAMIGAESLPKPCDQYALPEYCAQYEETRKHCPVTCGVCVPN